MSRTDPTPEGRPTAAQLLRRLWDELLAVIGTPATAAVVRRAVKRASERRPGTALPEVRRSGIEYACTSPASWETPGGEGVDALRELVRADLGPLLRELTGPVIARRLARVPELVEAGLAGAEET